MALKLELWTYLLIAHSAASAAVMKSAGKTLLVTINWEDVSAGGELDDVHEMGYGIRRK